MLYIASRDHTFPLSITTHFLMFVCLFVSYCFVSEERGGNQLDGMCNSSYAFYKLPTVLILLID